MKRKLSIAELIRQDVLDLHPEPPCLNSYQSKESAGGAE